MDEVYKKLEKQFRRGITFIILFYKLQRALCLTSLYAGRNCTICFSMLLLWVYFYVDENIGQVALLIFTRCKTVCPIFSDKW